MNHMTVTAKRLRLALSLGLLLVFAPSCTDDVAGQPDTGTDVRPDTSDTSAPPDTESDTTVTPDTGPDTTVTPDVPVDDTLSLSGVIPGRGLTTGLEQVEVVGTGFFQGMQVFFGESLAVDIFVLNSTRLVLLTPPRGPGLVDVRVVDPESGASARLEAGFLYFNPITILSVEPAVGHVLGGERVIVRGAGFRPESVLLFGRKAALQVQILDDQTISAIAPDQAAVGAIDVHVSNTQGVGTLEDGFLYVDVPRIDAVIPPVGPLAGGTAVELRGQGFHEPLVVLFGGQPLTEVRRVSEGRITGKTPAAQSQGPVDVIVSTPYGTG
ncbi:MAG TPA: IPT/TIG domain-containing protein, partial [Myxococcota bacterium]|nr:IPT/TIG domain-containing protein [Myxococcota bacterium]